MEMLAYLAMLGMLLSIIYSIYYQFSRTLSAADRTMLKERNGFNAAHMLQDDVRRSSKVMEEFGSFRAIDGALILLAQNSDDSGNDVIIYRFSKSESTLVRHEASAENPSKGIASRRVGFDVEKFDFSVDKENTKLVKVSILVKGGSLGVLRNQPLVLHALMRNG
jgi:hypothetical protein